MTVEAAETTDGTEMTAAAETAVETEVATETEMTVSAAETETVEQESILTKVGEFSDPNQMLQFQVVDENSGNYVIYTVENEGKEDQTYTLYDYLGNQVMTCGDIETKITTGYQRQDLPDDMVIFTNPGELCTETGLMKKDGTILIAQEPGIIRKLNDRYFAVYHAEAVTEDVDNALFSSTGTFYFYSSEDYTEEILYSGYAEIYDLEKERFVPNIKLTSDSRSVEPCGDSDTMWMRTRDGSHKIYDCDGNVLLNDASEIMPSGQFYIQYIRGDDGTVEQTIVYSSSLEGLFTISSADVGVTGITGTNFLEYIDKSKDGSNNRALMDAQGNLLTEPIYYGFSELSDGYWMVSKEDENSDDDSMLRGVMRSDGTFLTEVCYDSVTMLDSNYASLWTKSTAIKTASIRFMKLTVKKNKGSLRLQDRCGMGIHLREGFPEGVFVW